MRRRWTENLGDPAVLSDLLAAASDCMAQVCAHPAEECDCRPNLMTPVEFAQWVEREVHISRAKGFTIRRFSRPGRKKPNRLTASTSQAVA